MKNFQVYKHPFYGFECVKIGFSWPAFCFTFIWMLSSRLWLSASIWTILYVSTMYFLNLQNETLLMQLAGIAMYLALWLIPAFQGNEWQISNLRKRGFSFLKVVQADSKSEAIANVINTPIEKEENNLNLQLENEPFFAKPSSGYEYGPLIVFVLVAIGLIATLLSTKPNDAAFSSYLLNGNRIQAAMTSQVEPGDELSAMALLEDIFSIVASGNLDNLEPIIQKKDYRLFVLYSVETNAKSRDRSLNQFSAFKKVDAIQAMGFNSTYIGLWGNFYKLSDRPLKSGVPVNLFEKTPNDYKSKNDPSIKDNKEIESITFKKAVSIIADLPEVAKQIDEDTEDVLVFMPGNEDDNYESINGKKYISVNFIEDYEDHVVTRERYYVSLDGKQVLVWNIENNEYQKVKVSTVNQFNSSPKQHTNKKSISDTHLSASNSSTSLSTGEEPSSSDKSMETSESTDVSYFNNPAPEYPILSKRRGEQGQVLLKVFVSSEGLPETIDIEKTSGFERLDVAAMTAVRLWKFKPASKDEKAVSSYIRVPITFTL